MVFLKKKILPKKKYFFYLFSMQLFSADSTMFSKKFFFLFLTTKSWKNFPQKLLIIGPDPFLRQSSPGHSPLPRSSFPFYKKSNAILSLLLSGYNEIRDPTRYKMQGNAKNQFRRIMIITIYIWNLYIFIICLKTLQLMALPTK